MILHICKLFCVYFQISAEIQDYLTNRITKGHVPSYQLYLHLNDLLKLAVNIPTKYVYVFIYAYMYVCMTYVYGHTHVRTYVCVLSVHVEHGGLFVDLLCIIISSIILAACKGRSMRLHTSH